MYKIKIKTSYKGIHRYKDAPEQVSFLRDWHRHLFGVQATIEVYHSNRDEEFFIIQDKLDSFLNLNLEGVKVELSCEQIAEKIYIFLREKGIKCVKVEVDEDNENSGIYEHEQ